MKKPSQSPQDAPSLFPKVPGPDELLSAPESSVEAQIDDRLVSGAAQIVLFYPDKTKIPNCWRDDIFFAAMNKEPALVEEIVATYPATFQIEYNPDPHPGRWRFRVGLVEQPEPIRHAPVIQEPQPAEKFPVSDAELQKMRFRPAAPGMCQRRGATTQAGSIRHRVRQPMILPPEK